MSTLQVDTINSYTPSLPVEVNDTLFVRTGYILSGSEIKTDVIRRNSAQAGITLSGSVLVSGFGNVHINYGHLSSSFVKVNDVTPASGTVINLSGSVTVTGNTPQLQTVGSSGLLSSSFAKIDTIRPSSENTVILSGSITVSGSNVRRFKFGNVNMVPTSSAGLPTGTIYRTGSNFDEIKIVV